MRIVAVADTHLFHGDLDVPDGDVFVHAGDLCRGGDLDELREVGAWIASLTHRHKVITISRHAIAGVTYLQDAEATLDGLRFLRQSVATRIPSLGVQFAARGELAAVWAKIPHGIDVLITHSPPAGFGDRSPVGGRAGCIDLLERITVVRPRRHLFGHIHQDGGLWHHDGIVLANVTTWECERAATDIDIGPRTNEIVPVHVPLPGRGESRSVLTRRAVLAAALALPGHACSRRTPPRLPAPTSRSTRIVGRTVFSSPASTSRSSRWSSIPPRPSPRCAHMPRRASGYRRPKRSRSTIA